MPIKGVLLFIALICSVPLCFVSPFYGIIAWQVIAFLNPQSSLFYWPPVAAFPWAEAIAIPTIIGLFLFSRRWLHRLSSRECVLLLLLWTWFAITSVISTRSSAFAHHADMTWYRLGFVSKILLMTFVIVAVVNNFERLRIMIIAIAGCFGYFVAKGVIFIGMTGGVFRIYGPPHSMIADNNDFGLALNMTLPIFFLLARTEEKRWVRWLCGFLFVGAIPVVFFTYSRGAMVGLVVTSVLMILQLRQRWILIPIAALAMFLALRYAPESWQHRMDPTSQDVMDGSAHERLNAWAFSRNLAADHPFTGGGFDTFTQQLFAEYAPEGNDIHGPHSIYFQVLAEHGYIGLFLYAALVIACFVSLYQTAKLAAGLEDQRMVQYAKMLRFSFVAFLASGTFLGRAYFDYFFSMVACVVILRLSVQEMVWEEADELDDAVQPIGEEQMLPQGS